MEDTFRTRSPNGSDSQSERRELIVRTVRTDSPKGSDCRVARRLTIVVDYLRFYLRYGLTRLIIILNTRWRYAFLQKSLPFDERTVSQKEQKHANRDIIPVIYALFWASKRIKLQNNYKRIESCGKRHRKIS